MSNNHLIIGLGGTGGRVISAFRKTIFQEHRNVDPRHWDEKTQTWLPPVARIGYLYVDSNGNDLENTGSWKVLGQSVKLDPDSLLPISDADVQSVFANSSRSPGIAPWLGDQETLRPMIANAGGAQGAQQIRRFGRFLFATKIKDFIAQLTNGVNKLVDGSVAKVTFHVTCTLAAGTGSGSLIDAISQIRRLYPDRNAYPIYLYLLITDKIVGANTGNFYPNQYAALSELNALKLGIFRPHNVAAVTPDRPELKDNYQQCYLITGENEKNDSASLEEQQQMVADFLYQKIVALKGSIPDQIHKSESFEDVSPYPHENNERSYFFGAFGVKRFAIPEQEIREKLAFSFAHQASLQFQFNNWSDAGFLKQPQNRDLPELVSNAGNNERWFLTDDHLKLAADFRLSGGKAWPRIREEWETQLENEKLDLMESYSKSQEKWLPNLKDFSAKHFATGFRERGVIQYYEDKRMAKADYAREIRAKIESDLFDRWKTGEDSVHDTTRIVEELLNHLRGRRQNIDQYIAAEHATEEEAQTKLVQINVEWSKLGGISNLMGKGKKVFENFTNTQKEFYIARTEAAAWEFSKELIQQLIVELTELSNQISRASQVISKGVDKFEKMVAARCAREEEINYRLKLVRLVEPDNIDRTIGRLITDQKVQNDQTLNARLRLCADLGAEQTFTAFAKTISDPRFIDVMSDACDEASGIAHENLFKLPGTDLRRIMGINIVEKLHEQHGEMTEQLQSDIRTLVQSAAAYMTFNDQQTQPSVQLRNPNIANMPKGTITVFLPKSPNLEQTFRADLKRTFERAISGGQTVQVVDSDHNPNEITIISVRYWFALRFLRPLLKLRKDYEATIRAGEGQNVHQIHLENHRCEVDGVPLGTGYKLLPNLFLLDTDATRKLALPTLLLARAISLIQPAKDPETGVESLYFAERNAAGRALTTPLALEATNMVELLEKLMPEQFEIISGKVGELLKSEAWRHGDKKAELAKALDFHLDDIYLQRGSNDLDKTYQRFLTATNEAKKQVT